MEEIKNRAEERKEQNDIKLKEMESADKNRELGCKKEKDALDAELKEKLEKEKQNHELQLQEASNKRKKK